MAKSNMNQDILKILMSEEEIKNRIQEMGDELYDRFENKNPMFVGVLNGCFIFMAGARRAAKERGGVYRRFLLQERHQELRRGADHPRPAA